MKKKQCFLLVGIFAVVAFLSPIQPVEAATLYVKCEEGYSGGTGTPEAPYASIAAAVSSASSGDTVMVMAGSVCDETVDLNKSLRLWGEDPARTAVRSGGSTITVNASDVEIGGLTISGQQHGILFTDNRHNVYVRNNIFTQSTAGITTSTRNQIVIENNVFFGVSIAIQFAYTRNSSYFSQILISSNIFYNIITGIDRHSGNKATFIYNTFYNVSTLDMSDVNGKNVDWYSAHDNLYTDPLFVDPDRGDLRLQNDPGAGKISPCIDAGPPVAVLLDPDGTRNDIGVYGGPHAARFWPYAGGAGPVVTELSVSNVTVAERDADENRSELIVKLRAKGEIR